MLGFGVLLELLEQLELLRALERWPWSFPDGFGLAERVAVWRLMRIHGELDSSFVPLPLRRSCR